MTWGATGSPLAPRSQHTATALPNGDVLVAGGDDGFNGPAVKTGRGNLSSGLADVVRGHAAVGAEGAAHGEPVRQRAGADRRERRHRNLAGLHGGLRSGVERVDPGGRDERAARRAQLKNTIAGGVVLLAGGSTACSRWPTWICSPSERTGDRASPRGSARRASASTGCAATRPAPGCVWPARRRRPRPRDGVCAPVKSGTDPDSECPDLRPRELRHRGDLRRERRLRALPERHGVRAPRLRGGHPDRAHLRQRRRVQAQPCQLRRLPLRRRERLRDVVRGRHAVRRQRVLPALGSHLPALDGAGRGLRQQQRVPLGSLHEQHMLRHGLLRAVRGLLRGEDRRRERDLRAGDRRRPIPTASVRPTARPLAERRDLRRPRRLPPLPARRGLRRERVLGQRGQGPGV